MLKVALVTGGTRGIGKDISIHLKNIGYVVYIFYKTNTHLYTELHTEYGIKGFQVDVSNYIQVQNAINKIIEKEKKIDVLVNNAGVLQNKLFHNMKPADWISLVNCNLLGVFNVTHCVLSNMIGNKNGNIINISSISGGNGYKGQTIYGATKIGLQGFTKSLCKEVGKYNIRVNCIVPGFIQTDILNNISDNYKKNIISKIPTGIFGKPKHISETVVMIINNSYISGSIITVDGGLTS